MEANAVIQLALLAVLPFIMQGFKQIPWVNLNKSWVCPLLCIVVSVFAAWAMKLPNWLLIGILTGAATNKVYDWVHDAGKETVMMLVVIFMLAVFLGGCGDVHMSAEYRQSLQQSAVNVAELNQRCQAGTADCNDCKLALGEASKTLNYLVDGLDGKESK